MLNTFLIIAVPVLIMVVLCSAVASAIPVAKPTKVVRQPLKVRFSLRAMLIFIALIAIAFGSYRVGYDSGYGAAIADHTADYVTFK
jgi:hypothetical protein